MKVILLGTKGGPRIMEGVAKPTCNVLDTGSEFCLIDCGLGVSISLVNAGYPLNKLKAIFITHHHSDHTLELGPLIHTAWNSGLHHEITVYGPVGTMDLLDNFYQSQILDITIRIEDEKLRDIREMVKVVEYDSGQIAEFAGMQVSAMRNEHPPIKNSFALKFEGQGKKIVFSGDTRYIPEMAEFATGADLLIHEAMDKKGMEKICERMKNTKPNLMEHMLAAHTFTEQVGEIASNARVKKVVLNHLIPPIGDLIDKSTFEASLKTTWDGDFSIAEDGQIEVV
mgnify:CR=1 FL=1